MKRFGPPWSDTILALDEVDIPLQRKCVRCSIEFIEGDQGLLIPHLDSKGASWLPWHLDCFLESVGIKRKK